MSSKTAQPPNSRSLTTSEIKRGLEKIKQTQIQLLSQLKGDVPNTQHIDITLRKPQSTLGEQGIPPQKPEGTKRVNRIDKKKEHQSAEYIRHDDSSPRLLPPKRVPKGLPPSAPKQKKSSIPCVSHYLKEIIKLTQGLNEAKKSELKVRVELNNTRTMLEKVKQQLRVRNERLNREIKSQLEDSMSQISKIPVFKVDLLDLIDEVHKALSSHEGIYQRLKISPLSTEEIHHEEEFQQSIENIIRIIRIWQDGKRAAQMSPSIRMESPRMESPRMESPRMKSPNKEEFKPEINYKMNFGVQTEGQLQSRANVKALVEEKKAVQEREKQLRKGFNEQEKEYRELIDSMEAQVREIVKEKEEMRTLFSTLSGATEENKLREQVKELLDLNATTRKEREKSSRTADQLTHQNSTLQHQIYLLECQLAGKQTAYCRILEEQRELNLKIAHYAKLQEQERDKIVMLQAQIQELERQLKQAASKHQKQLSEKVLEIIEIRATYPDAFEATCGLKECRERQIKLERECARLQRESYRVNTTVEHLWDVKQAEYQVMLQLLCDIP